MASCKSLQTYLSGELFAHDHNISKLIGMCHQHQLIVSDGAGLSRRDLVLQLS